MPLAMLVAEYHRILKAMPASAPTFAVISEKFKRMRDHAQLSVSHVQQLLAACPDDQILTNAVRLLKREVEHIDGAMTILEQKMNDALSSHIEKVHKLISSPDLQVDDILNSNWTGNKAKTDELLQKSKLPAATQARVEWGSYEELYKDVEKVDVILGSHACDLKLADNERILRAKKMFGNFIATQALFLQPVASRVRTCQAAQNKFKDDAELEPHETLQLALAHHVQPSKPPAEPA